jgi:hypothetical protein
MAKNRKLIVTGAGLAVLSSLVLAGATFAHAGYGNGNGAKDGTGRYALTEEQKTAHQTEMREVMDESLTSAVSDGSLTADQKIYIETKLDEIHTKIESDDRDGADAIRDELDQWMANNGIDRENVMPVRRGGMGHKSANGEGLHRGGQNHEQASI